MPRRLAWGYRATFCDEDGETHANVALPVHLLADVAGYTDDALPRRYRRNLCDCAKRATIVELTGPALLREQGFEVKRSAVRRTGYGHADSHDLYLADLDHFFMSSSQLVLAAIVDDRLGGYLTGTLVRGSAHIDNVWIATEALRSAIGVGMVFEFVQACRRGSAAREVAFGLDSVEDPTLVAFKRASVSGHARLGEGLGQPTCCAVVRRRRPHAYYRLTASSAKQEWGCRSGRGRRRPSGRCPHRSARA
jgi:hypothetical protein